MFHQPKALVKKYSRIKNSHLLNNHFHEEDIDTGTDIDSSIKKRKQEFELPMFSGYFSDMASTDFSFPTQMVMDEESFGEPVSPIRRIDDLTELCPAFIEGKHLSFDDDDEDFADTETVHGDSTTLLMTSFGRQSLCNSFSSDYSGMTTIETPPAPTSVSMSSASPLPQRPLPDQSAFEVDFNFQPPISLFPEQQHFHDSQQHSAYNFPKRRSLSITDGGDCILVSKRRPRCRSEADVFSQSRSESSASRSVCDSIPIDGSAMLLGRREDHSTTFVPFHQEFNVVGMLGSGVSASVFAVTRLNSDSASLEQGKFAIKKATVPFRSRKHRELLVQEARILEDLSHNCSNVIGFFKAWQEDGYLYMQLEAASRGTLHGLLDRLAEQDQGVPDSALCQIVQNVSMGLSHIHSHGYVHMDIKPANLLISDSGVIKIADFGMTVVAGVGMEGEDGDTRYMAAELLLSSYRDPSADIFSLGISIFEAITIKQAPSPPYQRIPLPFGGPMWHALRTDQVEPRLQSSSAPPFIRDLVASCMAAAPTSRPTAEEICRIPSLAKAAGSVDPVLASAPPEGAWTSSGKTITRLQSFTLLCEMQSQTMNS